MNDIIVLIKIVSTGKSILRYPEGIYNKKGRSDPYIMFSVVFVFVDHVSGFMSINNQVAINTT